jgi:hypothetical protein
MVSDIGPENTVLADTTGRLDQSYLQKAGLGSVGSVLHITPQEGILHGFHGVPTTVLLDKEGIVKFAWVGVLNDDEVAAIGRLLHPPSTGSDNQKLN